MNLESRQQVPQKRDQVVEYKKKKKKKKKPNLQFLYQITINENSNLLQLGYGLDDQGVRI
jgi:hypothetical protein